MRPPKQERGRGLAISQVALNIMCLGVIMSPYDGKTSFVTTVHTCAVFEISGHRGACVPTPVVAQYC